MKQFLTILSFTVFILSFADASTIYVRSGQNGDGSSWNSSMGDLQKALDAAIPGTEIWVARGTYFPSQCKQCTPGDRAKTFKINDGVKLYGGFAGNETSKDERNPMANPTVLSGHIGFDDLLDNTFTVVYFENVSSNTVLDGFTVNGGMADASEKGDAHPARSGAGIYNVCTRPGGISSPVVKNCLFFENMAAEGGAIFNYSEAGNALVMVENSSFLKNKGVNAGGAVMDKMSKTASGSTFTDCKFVNNEAKFGGAYFSDKADSNKELFNGCKFINNESEFGAAGYISSSIGNGSGIFSQTCSFKNNKATDGNKIYIQKGQAPKTTDGKTISL